MTHLIRFIVLFITVTQLPVLCRKHRLVLENDIRKYFSITTFGFFSDGQLEVHLNYLTFLNKYKGVFGLTLTKTVSDGITPYMESHQNKCLLVDDAFTNDGNIEIISFLLNPSVNEVQVNCSRLSALIDIQPSFDLNNSTIEPVIKPSGKVAKFTNAASQIIKQKRSADPDEELPKPKVQANADNSTILTTEKPNEDKSNTDAQKAVLPVNPDSEKKGQSETGESSISKICTSSKLTYKNEVVEQWRQFRDLKFVVYIKSTNAQGLYSLYFHNCAGMRETAIPMNLSISIIEKNGESYLSAGEIPLPRLYFLMSFIFFIAGCIWISILKRKREEVFKIHYLMGLLVFVKSLSLLFHGINFHIIGKDGSPMEAWAVLYYITHLLKGALLFITIVLIGTGWAFIKHILSDKDKKIFMIVIPLQVLANVAKIIMEESEEGDSQHYTWREVFILVDLVCCGAILFPVVWSIRHLQEASHIDGKAAINLEKLKLFRRFYIMIVCYIYFTRIIVYLLQITVPFQYEWLDEMFRETATLAFFILTGYNFRPTISNPYFRLTQDDDLEMDVVYDRKVLTTVLKKDSVDQPQDVITQTGFTEQATKTVRSRELSGYDETTPTKRESSHEYD